MQTLDLVMDSLLRKQTGGLDIKKFVAPHLYEIFNMLLKCHGVLLNFKLLGKIEPQSIADSKTLVSDAMKKL